MKRIIPLFAAICLFLCCLVIPVRADDINNALGVVDVLQYSTMNDSGKNNITFTGSVRVYYDLPESMYVTYVDMVVATPSNAYAPVQVLCGRSSMSALNILRIGNGLYRVYGEVPRYLSGLLYIEFTSSRTDVESYYQVVSFTVSEIEKRHFDDKVAGTFSCGTQYKSGTWEPGGDPVEMLITPTNANSAFSATFTPLNWERYDFFDFYLYASVFEINSITAKCGNVAVPISVQYLGSGSSYGDHYNIMVRMDLRGLDKTGVDPILIIEGGATGDQNGFMIMSGSGFIIFDSVDPCIYAIRVGVADLLGAMNNLAVAIDMGFGGLYQVNQDGFQSIVGALSPESGALPGIQDTVTQQSADLGDITGAMNGVSRPDVGSIDFELDSFVSTNAIMAATQPLAVIMNNSIFKTVILISVSLALAGYVLFGKR